jgi:hypothetical protein
MPPDSSKKRSNTIVFCVGSVPRARARGGEIIASCSAGEGAKLELAHQVVARTVAWPLASSICVDNRGLDVCADRDTAAGELVRAARRLAEPERNRRRLPLRIVDAMRPGLDSAESGTTCCRAGKCRRRGSSMAKSSLTVPTSWPRGLEHDVVVGGVGNRAARRERP